MHNNKTKRHSLGRVLLRTLPALLLSFNAFAAAPAPQFPPAPQLPPQLPPAMQLPPLLNTPDVSFARGISLAEFTRLVLEDVLKVPFVLSPALISATQQVGVSVNKLSTKEAQVILTRVLKDNGFDLQPGPVYYVVQLPPKASNTAPDRDWLTCKPQNRPVSYFASALPAVFPDAVFSFEKNRASNSTPGSGAQAGLDLFFAQVAPSQKKELFRLIDSLDTPIPRVMVKAVLLEVSSDNRSGDGVRLAASTLGGKLGISIGTQPTGNSIAFKTGNLDVAFGAFDGDTRFKTISSPVLVVNHANEGRFQVGSQVPVTTSSTNNGTTTSNVEFKDVGTIVSVIPQVVGNTVTMSVKLELSDVSQMSTGTTSAPTILTRNLTAQTTLENGSMILLGNLKSTRSTQANNRFFGFNLNDDKSSSQSELVLMLYVETLPLSATEDAPRCR